MKQQRKILFIDRDGTLIVEPEDKQVDDIAKLKLLPDVIPALLQFKRAGYALVMVSNQDGLGTDSFPLQQFTPAHELMLDIFKSQGITFEAIGICPHVEADRCDCRKPNIGLVREYLISQQIDRDHSYVIGDRHTDVQLAENLGIKAKQIGTSQYPNWLSIARAILMRDRQAVITRKTNETDITASINLDNGDNMCIDTGIAFFNHMLEQFSKHSGFGLSLIVNGDLAIDDHHTVEDTGIVLGELIRKALHDKLGINRYGYVLPMDEALAQVAIDLSGRAYFSFKGQFNRERVGDLSTELIPHFFSSFADSLKATLHIDIQGENTHHMIEAIFKCVGRALRQAAMQTDTYTLPSTKGVL